MEKEKKSKEKASSFKITLHLKQLIGITNENEIAW